MRLSDYPEWICLVEAVKNNQVKEHEVKDTQEAWALAQSWLKDGHQVRIATVNNSDSVIGFICDIENETQWDDFETRAQQQMDKCGGRDWLPPPKAFELETRPGPTTDETE